MSARQVANALRHVAALGPDAGRGVAVYVDWGPMPPNRAPGQLAAPSPEADASHGWPRIRFSLSIGGISLVGTTPC
jgi:hypothetical protein